MSAPAGLGYALAAALGITLAYALRQRACARHLRWVAAWQAREIGELRQDVIDQKARIRRHRQAIIGKQTGNLTP